MIKPYLKSSSPKKREGVVTRERIPADTVIEASPVVVMSTEERILLDKTLLHDYIFEWGADKKVVARRWDTFHYNHAYQSNCEYFMDYEDKQHDQNHSRHCRRRGTHH
jgi:hypothetical protein